MPLGAPNLKQTTHHPALAAFGGSFAFSVHHARPFRRHHMLFLIVSVVFVGIMLLELTSVISRQSLDPRKLFTPAVGVIEKDPIQTIKSSRGFELGVNSSQFSVSTRAHANTAHVPLSKSSIEAEINSVIISPLPSFVPAAEAAAELEVTVETDDAAFATFKAQPRPKTDITAITADYFTPKPSNIAEVHEESRTTEVVGDSLMTKAVYVITPKFAGNPTRTIVWSTQVKTKPLAVIVRGITNGSTVPSTMVPVFQSMNFETDVKVKGLSVFSKESVPPTIEQKYMADLVSPAVVKVYHVVCGALIYDNKALASDSCSGTAGSGFIVSADGYIATNGHVVVYGAKDMLVNALLSDPILLEQFLLSTRLTKLQVKEVLSRADLTASVISGLYDIPDNRLKLENQRELTVVAIGNQPFEIENEDMLKQVILNFESTDNLKQATVVGYDYAAKDKLTVIADPKQGFSASDVALLKINQPNSPIIGLSTAHITQNQKISLFGFPGDADNPLTDNSKLGVSVTNGAISAIREAAGSGSKLYQSDADASHGNSGGPAIDEDGNAFGLLTYRYTSGESEDAAKSYIRDIRDFSKLVEDKSVILTTTSQTQDAWRRGIDLYSRQYYSKAIKEFEEVQRLYPSHRLVATYIELSRQAVADGKDIKDPPTLLIALGIGAGMGGLGTAILMISKHHTHHRHYRRVHRHASPA